MTHSFPTRRSSERAYELLDGAQREQARASRLNELGRQRVDAGLDNQLQLRQSESTIAAARQQAQAAQQQIDALRNALAALLGKGTDRGLDIPRPQLLDANARESCRDRVCQYVFI